MCTLTSTIYIRCVATYISLCLLQSQEFMSTIGVIAFDLSFTMSSANAGGMTFYIVSLVDCTMQWSIYLWCLNMVDCVLKITFNALVSISAIRVFTLLAVTYNLLWKPSN